MVAHAISGARRAFAAAGSLALGLALVAGCGSGIGADEPSGPDRSPATAVTSPAATTSAPAQDTLEEDIDAAVQVVDRYWTDHWSDLFTGTYRSPRVLGAYDGDAPGVPTCAGRPLADDNAVYCSVQDYIAWDIDLMTAGYRQGDAWVYLVIAHEWGHAVQNRLDRQLVSLAAELQADCLAGAVLFGAARDGTLQFEQGDTEELTQALTVLADDTPWTDPSDHGNAQERINSFARGGEQGVRGCLPV